MGIRIDVVMTDSRKLFVPIADRPLLGVPEAEALNRRAGEDHPRQCVRNALLMACMAGSTTMHIRRAGLDSGLDSLPAWHA